MALTYTPYSEVNQAFSNRAHIVARKEIYPKLFNKHEEEIHYLDLPDAKKRDYEMGIDRTIAVDVAGLRAPIRFTVQERFRKPNYAPYRDMTITAYNENSGVLSELYKIEAALMVYGYFNPDTHHIMEAIVCRVPVLMEHIVKGSITLSPERNPRSNQIFYCFLFDDLLKLPGVVKMHYTGLS